MKVGYFTAFGDESSHKSADSQHLPSIREVAPDMAWLTYREAARRVHRTVRTIRRWKKNGMPTILRDGIRYVEEEALLAWWRARLQADPAHRWRMRKHTRHAERERSNTASGVTP